MTENQWPQDGSTSASPAVQQASGTQSVTAPANTDRSASGMIKEEAGNVAGQAADSATTVVETAKTEASDVASEVNASARQLFEQAKLDLADQAGIQQQKVAAGLRSISEELHSMASASDQRGVASDLVQQAADRSASLATWLDERDPGSLLDEMKSFARRRPAAFLLLAAGAGVLAGRLTRSLSTGGYGSATSSTSGTPARPTAKERQTDRDMSGSFAPGPGRTAPPPPVQLPGPDVTTAGYAGGGGSSAFAAGPADVGTYALDPVYGNPPKVDAGPSEGFPVDPQPHERLTEEPITDDSSSGRAPEDSDETERRFGAGPDSRGPR